MITFGNAVQDFYLEKIRLNQRERKKRLGMLKTREDAEKLVLETRSKVRSCFQFPAEKCALNAQVTGRLERPGFVMEKILFRSREDYTVSANFYLPETPQTT